MYEIKFLLRITKGNLIFLFKNTWFEGMYMCNNYYSIFKSTQCFSRSKVEVQNSSQCSMETSRNLIIRSKSVITSSSVISS